jgi:PAS domain S-box-containing protein
LASIPIPIVALVAAVLGGLGVAALMGFWSLRGRGPAADPQVGETSVGGKLENYQMILDTLDRSNVLLWWARVWRENGKYEWRIRTPPQLHENPIYRLASAVELGGLWKAEQAPDDERTKNTAEKALAEGAGGYQQEFRIRGEDKMHWLSEEVIIKSSGPDEWNLTGVIVDITKRHEAEEARRRSEGQVADIIKGADCLLWQAEVTGDVDGELRWTMFIIPSGLYHRLFGGDPSPNQTSLWRKEIVPEYDAIQRASREALRDGRPEYAQEFHVVTQEQVFCVQEQVTIRKQAPGRWNLVGVMVDITARRDAELALASEKERLAVTLGTMTEGVITMDARGRVLFVNKAAADLLQWSAPDTVGRDVSEVCRLLNSENGVETNLPVKEIVAGGALAELPPQTLLKGRADRKRLVEGRLAPVADAKSKRVGAVFVLRDVTDRHRMEEQLQNAAKMESVGLLAGGLAHDFNNILTAVLSNLTLLQLDLAGMPDAEQVLAEAVKATKRAGELTLQLLTFAKGGDPIRAAVHLHEVIREAATFANRGTRVGMEFDLPGDLRAANVDKGQISQVIQNLVLNSVQAMPEGGTIRIGAENEQVAENSHPPLSGGDYIRVTVKDTGKGIAPEHIGKIFDPYFTTKVHGHGLGLATAFSIIRKHQGHIEVASEAGAGSTFTFWLPAASTVQAEPPREVPLDGVEKGRRVLFMDDEEPILKLAERLMVRLGLEFESAPDGARAIAKIREAKAAGRPFDLVVMDLTIPGGMGGKEAISLIRQIDPNIRAIVSSGYSSDLTMADYRKHGFQGMVAKPYDIAELTTVVRSVLSEAVAP